MWTHNLNQTWLTKKDVNNSNARYFANAIKLGSYYGAAITRLHTDFTSKYYSSRHVLGIGRQYALLLFVNTGIVCTLIKYHSGSKYTPSYYTYIGLSGFIPVNDIVNSNIKRITETGSSKIYITTANGHHFTFPLRILCSLPAYLQTIITNYATRQTSPITVAGNIFNLDDDPSFAGLPNHMNTLKRAYGDMTGPQNNQLIAIKARYTAKFNSSIFHDCIHLRKYFMASFSNSYVLLFKVKEIGHTHIFFFTGENYCIPTNYLTNEATYTPSLSHKWFILVSPTFILTLSNPILIHKQFFPYIPQNHILSSFVGAMNPLFVPKTEYKQYMKKQYSKIAYNYKLIAGKGLSAKFKLYISPSYHKFFNVLLTVIATYVIFLRRASFELLVDIPLWLSILIILMMILICTCITSWQTFKNSQAISPAVAICLTIFTVLFPFGDGLFSTKANFLPRSVSQIVRGKPANSKQSNLTKQHPKMNFHFKKGTYYLKSNQRSLSSHKALTIWPNTNFMQYKPTILSTNKNNTNLYLATNSLQHLDSSNLEAISDENKPIYQNIVQINIKHNYTSHYPNGKQVNKGLITFHGSDYITREYARNHHINIIPSQTLSRIYQSQQTAKQIIDKGKSQPLYQYKCNGENVYRTKQSTQKYHYYMTRSQYIYSRHKARQRQRKIIILIASLKQNNKTKLARLYIRLNNEYNPLDFTAPQPPLNDN